MVTFGGPGPAQGMKTLPQVLRGMILFSHYKDPDKPTNGTESNIAAQRWELDYG